MVYERLPSDIASRQVLLMDPLVGTGRTACRAVEVRWCISSIVVATTQHRGAADGGQAQPMHSRRTCRGCWCL